MSRQSEELERVEVPADHPGLRFAERRIRAVARHYAGMSQCGTLDLFALARECYLQGVWDGCQVVVMRPNLAEELKRDSNLERHSKG